MMARFVWAARGLSLPGRIRHLEERWAYYLAFGESFRLLSSLFKDVQRYQVCHLLLSAHWVQDSLMLPSLPSYSLRSVDLFERPSGHNTKSFITSISSSPWMLTQCRKTHTTHSHHLVKGENRMLSVILRPSCPYDYRFLRWSCG